MSFQSTRPVWGGTPIWPLSPGRRAGTRPHRPFALFRACIRWEKADTILPPRAEGRRSYLGETLPRRRRRRFPAAETQRTSCGRSADRRAVPAPPHREPSGGGRSPPRPDVIRPLILNVNQRPLPLAEAEMLDFRDKEIVVFLKTHCRNSICTPDGITDSSTVTE